MKSTFEVDFHVKDPNFITHFEHIKNIEVILNVVNYPDFANK